MTRRLSLLALLLSVTCSIAWAQVGPEFQVNSYTTGFQYGQVVVADANGNFVVVWASYRQDGSSWGVFGQRFDPAGVPQGSEFQVNSYTTNQAEGAQVFPAVASAADGSFVVVWDSRQSPLARVAARRFDANGIPQGSEFQLSNHGFRPAYPAVASDATGNFVVVWERAYQDGSGDNVIGQRFNAAGIPQGSEFQVNSYTTGDQSLPAVASDANGNFVVVWSSDGQDGSGLGVFGQRFNAAGIPQGSEFRVNSVTTSHQDSAAVASDANGSFLVAWNSLGQDGSSFGVFGQRFNTAGMPQGSGFRINSHTTDGQDVPAVASAANGSFVVTWNSYAQDGSYWGVFAQRYDDLIFRDGFE